MKKNVLKSEAAVKLYNGMLSALETAIGILILLALTVWAISPIYFLFFAPFSENIRVIAGSFIILISGAITIVLIILSQSKTDINTIHITSSSIGHTENQGIRRLDLQKEFFYVIQLIFVLVFVGGLVYGTFVSRSIDRLLSNWLPLLTLLITLVFANILVAMLFNLERERLTKNPSEHYPELDDLISQGELRIPKRCHVGETHNISLSLNPAVKKVLSYFEVELQGAGLKVNGDLKQQRLMESSDISYLWNCNFPISGTQVINLIMRLAGSSEYKSDILIKSYEVDVLSRYRQWIPPILVAFATIFSAIIGLLHSVSF